MDDGLDMAVRPVGRDRDNISPCFSRGEEMRMADREEVIVIILSLPRHPHQQTLFTVLRNQTIGVPLLQVDH